MTALELSSLYAKGNTVGSQFREIVIGSLLGDGFLEQDGKYKRFVCCHSVKQQEYILWKFNQMNKVIPCKLNDRIWIDYRNNQKYSAIMLRSKTSPIWEKFYDLFYKDDHRMIPDNLPAIISAPILAVWIMDNGYLRSDCNAMRLNTQAYSYAQHQVILQSLEALGIKASVHRQTKYWLTYIPSSSLEALRKQVRPYILPSMKYKLA